MPSSELLLSLIMMGALTFYVLLGGADYGGGMWDLFASGPRKRAQRELIADAIGPIWEANHVWLILVVVMSFTAFPPVFALVSTALHVPLVLMLIGIVMRGSAFTFRTYDHKEDRVQHRWGLAFAIPSLITPVLIGIVVGAISSGRVRQVPEELTIGYFFTWVAPFPIAVGFFAVVLFAFLAAVYLTMETEDPDLQDDFRWRAIASEFAAGALALLVYLLSFRGAPELQRELAGSWWTWPLQITTGLLALGTLWCLWRRRFGWARLTAVGQVSLILWGWGLAQFPYLVRPDLTIENSAAPAVTQRLLLITLAAGSVLLLPSYWYLMRVFKGRTQADR
jgi:cytochrome bd ubiquinol oxidase subunit II